MLGRPRFGNLIESTTGNSHAKLWLVGFTVVLGRCWRRIALHVNGQSHLARVFTGARN